MLKKVSAGLLLLVTIASFGLAFLFSFGGYCLSSVEGISMEPVIPDSSMVILQKPREIEAGQIIVFNLRSYVIGATEESVVNSQAYRDAIDRHIMHRIVEERDGGFLTKGDNNEIEDLMLVRREDVLAVYVWHSPFLSRVFLSFAAVLLVCLILLIGRNH